MRELAEEFRLGWRAMMVPVHRARLTIQDRNDIKTGANSAGLMSLIILRIALGASHSGSILAAAGAGLTWILAGLAMRAIRLGRADLRARRRRRVLLVEDDDEAMGQLARLMSREGLDVVCAPNLSSARAILTESQPDWLVIDLALPDGPGEDLLRHAREAAMPMRVIVFTGSVDPARLAEVDRLRPDAVLSKSASGHQKLLDLLRPPE